ncbi:Alcohol dehydrogenase superfamily, zinc-type [Corchorus capsularis]|uniref:cinnamyl-alcohol dehydrogenase n=1 Tax=Corchorus capsularis TaxID=210143 RepID=A0A1R3KG48_COCAP|nr:Alcohol dehydrogenase superfamily, zinc-type [Corchorus capsularis]
MSKSPEQEHPNKAFGWAAKDNSGVLSPFKFSRRATGEKDVAFKVLFCGVCHSDLHMIKNEWGNSIFPMVPGHEIVGEVTEVGKKVQKFKVGDKVGVGCMAAAGTLDGIIDTVSANHPLMPLIGLLKTHGKLVIIGVPEKPHEFPAFPLLAGRKMIGGSMIGGLKETQEMIDFAAKNGIKPNIEVIAMDYVNTAMERLLKADVKYRFVIDVGNSLKATS